MIRMFDLALTRHEVIFLDQLPKTLDIFSVEGVAGMMELKTVLIRRIVGARQRNTGIEFVVRNVEINKRRPKGFPDRTRDLFGEFFSRNTADIVFSKNMR